MKYTYTFPPGATFSFSRDGREYETIEMPVGTHGEDDLDAFVRAKTGGLVGIETEAGREARAAYLAKVEAESRAEYEAATRPQRPGRQIPFCELRNPDCVRRSTRKGLVPWSDDPEIARPEHRWMCFECWMWERLHNYPGCDD